MSGYVAMARVSGAQVRAVALAPSPPSRREWTDIVTDRDATAVLEDPWIDELAERLARARETFAIMTFFLTDPNSWR